MDHHLADFRDSGQARRAAREPDAQDVDAHRQSSRNFDFEVKRLAPLADHGHLGHIAMVTAKHEARRSFDRQLPADPGIDVAPQLHRKPQHPSPVGDQEPLRCAEDLDRRPYFDRDLHREREHLAVDAVVDRELHRPLKVLPLVERGHRVAVPGPTGRRGKRMVDAQRRAGREVVHRWVTQLPTVAGG